MRLERAVDAYLRHLTIERGLSEHTIAAYRRDLEGYAAWLRANGVDDADAVTPAIAAEFAAARAGENPPPAAASLCRSGAPLNESSAHRCASKPGPDPRKDGRGDTPEHYHRDAEGQSDPRRAPAT